MADEEKTGLKQMLGWFSFDRVKWIVLLVILALLVVVIWQNGLKDIFSQDGTGNLLTKLSQVDFGRFLITSLIVLIVVVISANMAFGLFNRKVDPEVTLEKRFLLGKELLTVFIGLLGTLMGFYFAENRVSPDGAQKIANIAQQNPGTASVSNTSMLETKAFDWLIKQEYEKAVTAFDDASKATPPSPNIANISTILKYLREDHKADFAKAEEVGKKQAWQDLDCLIYRGGMAIGQSKDIIDKFGSGCNPAPPPANTSTPTETPANTGTPQPQANKPANMANANANAKPNKTP